MQTIDMQDMRYLNLFEQLTGVRTRFCFRYNENIIFCVPKPLVSKAVGQGGRNIRRMSEILGKRIRVIAAPRGISDSGDFIKTIISPLTLKDFEVTDTEIIAGGGKNKAALIGRNKRRLLEMQKIVRDFFERDFRIA